MILNALNILGIFLILLSLFVIFITLIKFLIKKQFNIKKISIPIVSLLLGLAIIFVVSLNHNHIDEKSTIYTSVNNAIPLSMNVVSGAKLSYMYNKKYIYKFKHNGQDVFRLSPLNIKHSTNLIVTQEYRNEFLVPTIKRNNVKIIKRN